MTSKPVKITHENQNVLCIIDVQVSFCPPDSHVDAVVHQVVLAKKRGDHIVVVELNGCGITIPKILETIGQHPFTHVTKHEADGSGKILSILDLYQIRPGKVGVVGLYTDACVARTVEGLRFRLGVEQVNVIPEAVWSRPWDEKFVDSPHLRQVQERK